MKSTLYKVLNLGSLIAVIAVNTLANTLSINGQRTGQVSAQYENLFTPAGFTFGIWSVIYLGLIAFVIFQAFDKDPKNNLSVYLGPAFLVSCIANVCWIFAWHYQFLGLSLACMTTLLVSLVIINIKVAILKDTKTSFRWFVWIPMALYLGWICVATIANIAVYLTSIHWDGLGISPIYWATAMIIIAGIVGIGLLVRLGLIPAVLSISWGLYGIHMKQGQLDGPQMIVITCLVVIGTMLGSIIIHTMRSKLFSSVGERGE